MKVFLSWSGERSKAVAQALKDWLPLCIQSLDPWMSAADIDKGARWFEQIEGALTAAEGQGIFCVTPENLSAPWLNFEAGFVASKGGKARVCALLVGLDPVDVKPPISLFQLTTSSKDDLLALLRSLNQHCGKPLPDRVLERAFEMNWPDLEKAIHEVLAMQGAPQARGRSTAETLAELVGITRRLEKSVAEQGSQLRRFRHSQMAAVEWSAIDRADWEAVMAAIDSGDLPPTIANRLRLTGSDRARLNDLFTKQHFRRMAQKGSQPEGTSPTEEPRDDDGSQADRPAPAA